MAQTTLNFRSWMWRAFISTSLVPLVMVEIALLLAYFLTNQSILESQGEYLRKSAARELQASVAQNADIVEGQLANINNLSLLLARNIETELAESLPYHAAELSVSEDGVRYSAKDDGGAASFYSNVTPLDRQDLDKVDRLSRVDFMMKALKDGDPLITSVYFNSPDSYNRIYPWIDTLAQYPHDMDITRFNFYYLADAEHNPGRQSVWTDVYLDPAGNGWMMSIVTPVYNGDTLKGVVGIDITVEAVLQKMAALHVPSNGYLVLVSDKLNIMALPQGVEAAFGVTKLETSSGYKGIRHEYVEPTDFNMGTHPEFRALTQALDSQPDGLLPVELDKRTHLIAWSKVALSGWRLLAVVDEAVVMQEPMSLARHFRTVGYLMVIGLIVFYIVFFAYLWLRARRLSLELNTPVSGLCNMMGEIGQGNWTPQASQSNIQELNLMSNHALDMGRQLADAESRRGAVQQRLEVVMESVTEGLWEYAPNTRTFAFKGALRERFGLPSRHVSTEYFLGLMPEEDRHAFSRLLEAAQHNEHPVTEVEFRLPDLQGELVWLLCRASTLPDAITHEPSVVGTCVDIDTLKQVEQHLRDKTLEAQAASQAKSRFISSMSHELKTPLNAILGFAQLSQFQASSSAALHAGYAQEIINAGTHLHQLVEDLLAWSSLQAESPRLALRPVDAGALLLECQEMIRPQAVAQGLSLALQLPDQPCIVLADARRLKQVMLNLLSNAAKYNRPAGSIVMGVEMDREHLTTRLFVADTGPGLDLGMQKLLFQPFQRLGKENSKIQGTGIGLALCRELAELMGARMGVSSETGVGSRFWIELPFYSTSEDIVQSPSPHQE
ncbi:sensor histidine kinase [Pseudomonas sp. CDFA 610]|uniref:sensor histidine kinase n=1 Tax=Pseudomonas sp. CDFA 610 TaxID=2829825 RepID=UPI001E47A551|nr:ATP-binding protein [Pseudomonas sp. CDFA 610]MCD5983212.1 PAS domain S-box protein [Pseudomonas sp. CDFA 610]